MRIHQTLRVPPAMEAGIMASVMSIRDIVVIAEDYLEEQKKEVA